MTDNKNYKYIIPKLNKLSPQLDPILKALNNNIIPKINELSTQLNTTLTDCFCVVGCSSIIDVDGDNPIYGGKPLGYTFDGINYYSSTSTIIDVVNKVDFNGYQWVACGSNVNYTQSLSISSDGINWITPVENVLQYNISDIAWGQKKWIAVGSTNGTNSRVAYSSNGMNWTLLLYNDDNHTNLNNVAYNGSYFLIGGFNYIAKSSDGLTWTEVDVTTILGFVKSITWNGILWVAAGSNALPIAYSYDGEIWVAANTGSLINSGFTVSYNGTQFLAAGLGNYRLISSKDGINWTGVMLNSNETYLPGSITDITWNGKYWIVTNATNNLKDPKIAYSSDLVTWYSSSSGNKLFSGVQYVNTITSRNRKNYYAAYF